MFLGLNQIFSLKTDGFIMVISTFVVAVIFVFLISVIFVAVLKNKLPKDSFIKIVNSIFRVLIIVVIVLLIVIRYIVLKR